MDEQLKRRLIGAAVLASLLVIFLPLLWETDYQMDKGFSGRDLPQSPYEKEGFQAKAQPLPGESTEPAVISTPKLIDESPVVPTVEHGPVASEPVSTDRPIRDSDIDGNNQDDTGDMTVPKDLSAWAVQVASFADRDNADQLARELQSSNYPAFVVTAEIKGKVWYRVRIGPEADKNRAGAMVEQLREIKGKGLNPRIIRHP